jgi:hypothetical protein
VPRLIDAIGVDEIQYATGHKYLTLVHQIDLGVTRLLWVAAAGPKSGPLSEIAGHTLRHFISPRPHSPNPHHAPKPHPPTCHC